MPVYEYYCPACRETFERLRPMSRVSEAALCRNGHTTERVMSLVASGPWQTGDARPAAGGGCACGGNCSCRG